MKLNELYQKAKQQGCTMILRFMRDMRRANIKMQVYHGRFSWHGPAVIVNNMQTALGSTKILCQWDNMAFDWVVYPKESMRV